MKDEDNQQFSKNGWKAHKVPPLSEDLLAVDGCLEQFRVIGNVGSFKEVEPRSELVC